jgi:hypothetical protein
MESPKVQSILGNDVRKKQQLAAEKERIKKEWERKKIKMAFLETDPFAGQYMPVYLTQEAQRAEILIEERYYNWSGRLTN